MSDKEQWDLFVKEMGWEVISCHECECPEYEDCALMLAPKDVGIDDIYFCEFVSGDC